MRKTVLTLICLLHVSWASSATVCGIHCPPRLEKSLKTIEQLTEAREFINEIKKQGPIKFSADAEGPAREFGACWDCDRRIIFVNPDFHESTGAMIGSILFELQNAYVSAKYDHLDHLAATGQINRSNYVREAERVEYHNSINAAAMAQKGIDCGLFPKDARLPTYPNFEKHFQMQQWAGHSEQVARNYDLARRLAHYRS
ncbi:MAG: hypothetical protein Q8K75_03345 [Chlamydiales bacterium]|nr:hypothetical protein [Chlamydiales bacterium]